MSKMPSLTVKPWTSRSLAWKVFPRRSGSSTNKGSTKTTGPPRTSVSRRQETLLQAKSDLPRRSG